MIRSSRHTLLFSNSNKLSTLDDFILEYQKVAQKIVDYIWTNGWKSGEYEFNVSLNKLNMPSLLTSDIIKLANITTLLSGRALKCCMTQCCGIIKAEVEKQRKRLFVYSTKKEEGVSKKRLKLLIKKIKQNIPVKPNCQNIKPELNSICFDIQNGKFFDKFIRLKSIWKNKREIKLPIKFHRHSLKLQNNSTSMKNSILISNDSIDLRWELPKVEKKSVGETVGADQGYKDVLNLANKTIQQKTKCSCPHGHTLESIITKVSRKKKGSSAFKKAKDHQKNFVNWSLNNIDLKNIKQINLERIWNIGYKSGKSRKMSHWQNTLIRDKVIDLCETNGVHFVEQSCTYRSQRCHVCGNVRKANRKGKIYECKKCGNIDDADHNAALNHSIYLPEIPWFLRKSKLNRKDGFIWNQNGLFDLTGRSLQSLLHVEE